MKGGQTNEPQNVRASGEAHETATAQVGETEKGGVEVIETIFAVMRAVFAVVTLAAATISLIYSHKANKEMDKAIKAYLEMWEGRTK